MPRNRLGDRQRANKDRSGGNINRWCTIPEGVELFEQTAGENLIDILPFTYATDLFLSAARKEDRVGKGELDYVLIINVHRNIGPNNHDIVCPRQFGKPCPICDEVQKMRDNGKEYEDFKDITYSIRVLYNVRNAGERNASIQLWEGSNNWIEKELGKRVERESARKGEIIFADYDEGKTISFYGEEGSFQKNKYIKPTDFSFEDRTRQPGEEILKETIALDSLITILSYQEIETIFFGIDSVETETKEPEKIVEKEPKKETEKTTEKEPEKIVEKEPERKREVSEEKKCSKGHIFGKDSDSTPDCDKCPEDEWKECSKAKRAQK
jgi:hypothetical protein